MGEAQNGRFSFRRSKNYPGYGNQIETHKKKIMVCNLLFLVEEKSFTYTLNLSDIFAALHAW